MRAESPDLGTSVTRLGAVLTGFVPRSPHLVADLVLRAYAEGVSDQAHATAALAVSRRPRAAYANARAAFEGALEALFLVSDFAVIDDTAAMVYAFEVIEAEQLRERCHDVDRAAHITDPLPSSPTPEQVIALDAAGLDLVSPGQGDTLRRALRVARQTKGKRKHWPQLSQRQLVEEVGRRYPEIAALTETADVFYGIASVHTHPRMRPWAAIRAPDPGDSRRRARVIDEVFPQHLARTAADLVRLALERRCTHGADAPAI